MHHKQVQAQKEWGKLADDFGFSDEKEMLTFLYWNKGLRPKCIGWLLEKSPQAISHYMKTIGIDRNQFRNRKEIQEIQQRSGLSFDYNPINQELTPSGSSPCKNCYHKHVSKEFCDCSAIKAYQQGEMGSYHFVNENNNIVYHGDININQSYRG